MEEEGEGGWTGGGRPGSSTSKSHSGGQVRQRGGEGIRSGVLLIRKLLAWHHSGWRSGFLSSSLFSASRDVC